MVIMIRDQDVGNVEDVDDCDHEQDVGEVDDDDHDQGVGDVDDDDHGSGCWRC